MMCNNNMQIKIQQERDSVRLVWNAMAASRSLQAKAAIPQALHYTILDQNTQSLLKYQPPRCNQCQAFMNPYNKIQIGKKSYTCCICKTNNNVPYNYFQGKDQMPDELTLNFTSFITAKQVHSERKQMDLLFLVDVALDTKELEAVKEVLLELVDQLQDDRTVGLITYDKYVNVHDLGSKISSVIKFSPSHDFEQQQFINLLFLGQNYIQELAQRYLVKIETCRQVLKQRIQNIKKTKHNSYRHERQSRSVGQAINVAITLSNLLGHHTRIPFFCGGVCTTGLGKIIQKEYKDQMRSVNGPTPPQSRYASRYYQTLGKKLKLAKIVIDSFIFSVQEVGLNQMLPCLKSTGGLLIQHQQFDSEIFRQSFRRIYSSNTPDKNIVLGTEVELQIKMSPEITLISFQDVKRNNIKKHNGLFRVRNMAESTTVTFGFQQKQNDVSSQDFHIQMISTFRDPNQLQLVFQRVTTIRRLFVNNVADMINGFDQEAALHLLAQQCIQKSREENSQNVRNWLDNVLIKWAGQFGHYKKGEQDSFKLPQKCRLLPQYLYYLRRSPIVRRNRISLDEYSYLQEIVRQQTTRNVLLIIQPALIRYSPDNPSAQPVSLDQRYMKSENILILDSFFNIVEWKGKDIYSWIQQKYHETEDYAYIKQIYKNLQEDVKDLTTSRFPPPCLYITHPGHSKQRFIKSRLGCRQDEPQQGNLTEEADINAFTYKLIQLVVSK